MAYHNTTYHNLINKKENTEDESRQLTIISIVLLVVLAILVICQVPKYITTSIFVSTLIILFVKIVMLSIILKINNELLPFLPKRNLKKLHKAANNPLKQRGTSKYHG